MGPRPRGRGIAQSQTKLLRSEGRFNGAATARSRNHNPARPDGAPLPQLQWGRDRAVAESDTGGTGYVGGWLLQWGRDRAVAESGLLIESALELAGFNGAATARSRNPEGVGK